MILCPQLTFGNSDSISSSNYLKWTYTRENGFPGRVVHDIIQDKLGRIWLLSDGNLISFQNKEFLTYESLPNDSFRLFNSAGILMKDRNGNLFSQNDNLIVTIDPISGPKFKEARNYKNNLLRSIEREQYSNLIKQQKPNYLGKIRNNIAYERNYPFFYGDGCIKLLKKSGNQYLKIDEDSIIGEIYTKSRLVYFFRKEFLMINETNFFKFYKIGCENGQELKPADIFNVLYLEGKYYAITKFGLYEIRFKEGKLFSRLILPISYPENPSINCMLKADNNSWFVFGTDNGLIHYTRDGFSIFKSKNQMKNSMNSILARNDGIYSNRGGIWSYTGEFRDSNINILNDYGFDYCIDSLGRIYIDHPNETRVYSADLKIEMTYPRNSFYGDLIEDEKKKIYHFNREGIFYFKNNDKIRLNIELPKAKDSDLMFSGAAYKDTLYLATFDGIYRYNLTKKDSPKPDRLLTGYMIKNIQVDPYSGCIYVFTKGAGVFILNGNNIIKLSIDKENHLLNSHYFVIENTKNRVWIPTNSGLIMCSYSDIINHLTNSNYQASYYYYYGNSIPPPIEFNGTSSHAYYYSKPNNRIFLSSLEGLVSFNPDYVAPSFPQKGITIYKTIIDGKMSWGYTNPSRETEIMKIQVCIPDNYSNHHFNWEFKFNTDKNWKSINNKGEITFGRIKGGTNYLYVRYKSGLNQNDFIETVFEVEFPKFWYEETWFYVLLLCFLILSFFAFSYIRNRSILRKKALLEKNIQIKTKELQVTLLDLTNSEMNLKKSNEMKERLIKILAHDIRSPLISTLFVSEHLSKVLNSDNSESAKYEHLGMINQISQTIKSVYNYSNEFLQWYRYHEGNTEIELKLVNISSVILPIIELYESIAKQNDNHFEFNNSKDYYYFTDQTILMVIIRNLLDNANKHSRGSKIKIIVEENRMYIINKPEHIEPHTCDFMISSLKGEHPNFSGKQGFSMGLSLVWYFTNLLDIKTQFSKLTVEEVIIELVFPLKISQD
ncbi:MAG: sensor histidine kinase [Bacteroidia bacterium]